MMLIERVKRAPRTAPRRWLAAKTALALLATSVADWLLYDEPLGISVSIFFLVLAVVLRIGIRPRAWRREAAAWAIFIAALMPSIEDLNLFSVLFGLAGISLLAAVSSADERMAPVDQLRSAFFLPLCGPLWLVDDIRRVLRLTHRRHRRLLAFPPLTSWVVPTILCAMFLYLFGLANPIVENVFLLIDVSWATGLLTSWRLLFWLAILCAIWPLIHMRRRRERHPATSMPVQVPGFEGLAAGYFGRDAILRSLILFNAMFAVETALDLAFLWGGMALPDGMSYASYAHRGAYPLIVTALLAAGFVLIAMRRNGPAEGSRLIRALVLIWTAQNIALVGSAIFRLDLYVAAYSLTYLRMAAFLWMVLVGVGLISIMSRILLRRSNAWLVGVNAAALAALSYTCCFVDFPAVIAQYDVEHSLEVAGAGPRLDLCYLAWLGPEAIPALDDLLLHAAHSGEAAAQLRVRSAEDYLTVRQEWRGWSFRSWRLRRYLTYNPGAAPDGSGS